MESKAIAGLESAWDVCTAFPSCHQTTSVRKHLGLVALSFKTVRIFGFVERLTVKNTSSLQRIHRGSVTCNSSLRELLDDQGIVVRSYVPGQHRIMCPVCEGGQTHEKSLALKINDDGESAVWLCHRAKCGWDGFVRENLNEQPFPIPTYQNRAKPRRMVARASMSTKASMSNGSATSGSWQRQGSTGAVSFPSKADAATESTSGSRASRPAKLDNLKLEPLDEQMQEFFSVREISPATWQRSGVSQEHTFSPHEAAVVKAMVFPYFRDGKIVNCKYRAPGKQFWQIKGAEKILYGMDDIKGQTTVYIVEGEIDKLSLDEVGILNSVSVPDGAPNASTNAKQRRESVGEASVPSNDKKYEYLWNCREVLDKAKRIVLATDADEPGQLLAEELARRLGRERCWRVKWPTKDNSEETCKDANEVLLLKGAGTLRDCLLAAEPFPIKGLLRFRDYFSEIDVYYRESAAGDSYRGVSTGWRNLDETYRVVPGELTVVTGVPNSGKSEWIDALLCNIAMQEGWTFALCSMENKVRDHARKLIEKYVGQPFFSTGYGANVPRMSPQQLTAGKDWVDANFHLIRCENDELPSIDWVLGLARAAVLRHGIRGLVIDPYNELDHQRGSAQTETEYVSQMLTKVKRFAQHHDCHVWFVAHPKQLQQWKNEPPGLYDISGSAHFVNKCDNGIVVHRNRDPEQGPLDYVQIFVRKVRNKAAGTIGEASLRYDRVNGRYYDPEEFPSNGVAERQAI